MARVAVRGLTKRFGRTVAVEDVTFEVRDGEFVVLLGPSGSGKTTTLKLIAGLLKPDRGEIWIGDRLVNDLPPKDRDVAMVFQNYALYPHMTAYENIAFPLKIRRLPKEEIDRRVREVAKLLRIEDLLDKYPSQLSGGQQQRVALGRAIVREPKVFLLDEPLSNLDAKLRVYMRAELKSLQRRLRVTTVYVTHDQVEAMTMADRIVVFNEGRVQQIGTPSELYNRPSNTFVASFIGSPPMNFFEVSLVRREELYLDAGYFKLKLPAKYGDLLRDAPSELLLGVRPEHIKLLPGRHEEAVEAEVYVIEPLGSETIVDFKVGDNVYKLKYPGEVALRPGDKIYLEFDVDKIYLFDKESGKTLL
ncbi:MAG: sugar ABC transporter ATP-binding protein [Thermoprotei archaeon]|nr:MAG: sugar ABC transporter ATP-binding protein [Thermoprotei archaeon]